MARLASVTRRSVRTGVTLLAAAMSWVLPAPNAPVTTTFAACAAMKAPWRSRERKADESQRTGRRNSPGPDVLHCTRSLCVSVPRSPLSRSPLSAFPLQQPEHEQPGHEAPEGAADAEELHVGGG